MIHWIRNGQVEQYQNDFVEYMYDLYVPNNSLIVTVNDDLANINLPDYISNIVFDSTHPWRIEDCLQKESLNSQKRPTFILTPLFNFFQNKVSLEKLQFFPFWALWMSQPFNASFNTEVHNVSCKTKKYLVSCLNGTEWAHRKLTYLALSKKDYFNQILFSFIGREHYQSLPEEAVLTTEELEELSKLPQFVSVDADLDIKYWLDLSVEHPAYMETYVNLVTETTVSARTPMLSEKTFKPIIAGQLFVLIASPGAVDFLRKIGIDTFDDVIDHGYDSVVDLRLRIQLAVKQIDKLVKLPLEKVYKEIKPRLKKNSEFFRSQEFRDQFPLNFG